MKKFFLFFTAFTLLNINQSYSSEKRFKRALIIGGMGISPGVGLGMIAGLNRAGYKPDLIIATCGSSMATAIYHAFHDDNKSLEYAKSAQFKAMIDQAKIRTKNLLSLQKSFSEAKDLSTYPPIFSKTVLHLPEFSNKFIPEEFLTDNEETPHVIILSAKADYGPEMVGQKKSNKSFTQVFFTTPDMVDSLKDFKSPISKLFPHSQLRDETEVIVGKRPEDAIRASIPDPFLINPAKMDNEYYFTGAVDLFPIELANSLADEVISNYPVALFENYEDLAIESAFGFKQTDSVLHDIQSPNVKWIDLFGGENLKFDPKPHHGIFMKSMIPATLAEFQAGIQKQWDFGFQRAVEGILIQRKGATKKHLRNPLEKYIKK